MSIRVKLDFALDILDMADFNSYSTPILLKLFYAIYFYQKVEVDRLFNLGVDAESWSDTFICKDDSWQICPNKVNALICKLYPNGYIERDAIEYYNVQYVSSGNVISDFPGKMLKVALQRYIKDSVIKLNPKLGSKFSNTDVTCTLLMSSLHRSKVLQENLSPVYNFLQS